MTEHSGSAHISTAGTVPAAIADNGEIVELETTTSPDAEDYLTRNSSRRSRRCRQWDYEACSREPIQLTWRQIFGITPHWRCLILTCLISVCLIMLLWCKIPQVQNIDDNEELSTPCRNGLVWIPTTIASLFYLIYLVECMHCNIHRDMKDMVSASRAHRLLDQWINARPLIRWKAICYHYGRGIRPGCSTNGVTNGTVQHLQFMRINSHSTEGKYRAYDCAYMDKSTPLKLLNRYHIVKVDIEKYFSFGCPCSEAAYISQRKAFYENNMAADDYIEVRETFHLSGLEVPDGMCIMKSDSMPWFCNKAVYWLMSLAGLSWPFRIFMERKIAYVNFTIHKQFGARCNGILATSRNSLSSFDSKLSDNQFGVIPSYSEALLMSSYTLNGSRVPATIHNLPNNRVAIHKSYETISSNHELLHRIEGADSNKIILSKTMDNLRRVCSVRHTFRRSSSVHSPILEQPTDANTPPVGGLLSPPTCGLSTCHLPPEIIVNGDRYTPIQGCITLNQCPSGSKLKRSKTTNSVIQTLKKALPKSKSLHEHDCLL